VVTAPAAATDEFDAATAPYRRELLAHCYRMVGSVHEAEDLVQETYVRAWRGFERFEHRSSVRTWLYRIATNVCLSALERRRHRPLPSELGPPSPDPFAPPEAASGDVPWLEPVPDRLVVDERGDPAEVIATRQSVRLALIAALQVLPARQRAAFILREVLNIPAVEAAKALDVSIPALKSLLQRARARIAEVSVTDDDLAEPTEDGARRVLDSYLAAFEQSDIDAIERLLADDAVLEMTGTTSWFSGKSTCVPYISAQAIGRAGDWRMVPLAANGQLGACAYHLGDDDAYHPFAVVVLATTTKHISRISLFADPSLFPRFALPPTLPARR
jgi:RNA polymerase sigma-70 factor (ECF subfamily)